MNLFLRGAERERMRDTAALAHGVGLAIAQAFGSTDATKEIQSLAE